jgi:hypothetical protein
MTTLIHSVQEARWSSESYVAVVVMDGTTQYLATNTNLPSSVQWSRRLVAGSHRYLGSILLLVR